MIEYSYDPPYNLWSGNRSDTLNKWKINYKGSIATASALPEKGDFKGDTYNVLEDGSNYMWNGKSWDKLDANVYVGATSTKDGIQGLVPPADSSERSKFLRGDGTYKDVTWGMVTDKPLEYTPMVSPNHIYVDQTNGNDANDGTQTNPVKTISAALGIINAIPLTDYNIYVTIEAGDYSTESITGILGKRVQFSAVNGTVKIKSVYCGVCKHIVLTGNWEINVGNGKLSAEGNAVIELGPSLSITFTGTSSDSCIAVNIASLVFCSNSATISFIYDNCTCATNIVVYESSTVRLTPTSLTMSGSFTGRKFSCTRNSCLSIKNGATNIPGTLSGITDASSFPLPE